MSAENPVSAVPLVDDARREDRMVLRSALADVARAINEKDWQILDRWLAPGVTITMIDQATMHGRDDLARYVESKLGRFSSILKDIQVDPIPDAPAVFYGDTAIATISSADRFIFRNGREFLVQGKYTATLVRQEGNWKLVAVHGGVNAFNNPISYQAQNLLTAGVAVAGVGGAVLGWILGRKS
jgi:ketosteroid isomerase-like protein